MASPLADTADPTRAAYYGDGGAGKTTALMAMAKAGRILVLNCEQGIKPRQLRDVGIPVENIEVTPGKGDIFSFELLDAELDRVGAALAKDPTSYAGVVWDGATEMYAKLLDIEVRKAYAKAQRLGKARDEHFVDLADYGPVTTQIRKLLRKSMDLPCHLGISVGVKREQDESSGKVSYVMDVGPAVRKSFIALMDVIGYFSIQTVEDVDLRKAMFVPRGPYYGKNRLGGAPPVLIEPGFDRLVEYVERKLTVDKDPVMGNAKKLAEAAAAKAANTAKGA